MNAVERRTTGAALLAMAEAMVAGRRAGRVATIAITDNPHDPRLAPQQHEAWSRGFVVGRSID